VVGDDGSVWPDPQRAFPMVVGEQEVLGPGILYARLVPVLVDHGKKQGI